jgi:hypothetical protein
MARKLQDEENASQRRHETRAADKEAGRRSRDALGDDRRKEKEAIEESLKAAQNKAKPKGAINLSATGSSSSSLSSMGFGISGKTSAKKKGCMIQ